MVRRLLEDPALGFGQGMDSNERRGIDLFTAPMTFPIFEPGHNAQQDVEVMPAFAALALEDRHATAAFR